MKSLSSAAILCAAAVACGESVVDPDPPVLAEVTAFANPYSVLSVRVALETSGLDSARLVFSDALGTEQATPFSRLRGGRDTLTALGLRANADYQVRVEATNGISTLESVEMPFRTGELPLALRGVRLRGIGGPSSGHTLTVPVFLGGESDGYVVAFDAQGEISWYRVISGEGWAVEARQQPNGNISVYVGRSYGWHPVDGRYVEFRPDGAEVRRFGAGAPFYTDPHDLILSFRDTTVDAVHLIGYDIQSYDPEVAQGRTSLAVHRILRQSPSGQIMFEWNASAHFTPADWPVGSVAFDLVHPSSLDLDAGGDYIVSLQALDKVVKIDAQTGAIVWELGGIDGDFTFQGDPLGGFHGQHSVRVLENGNLLMFDNRAGPDPLPSRAAEYRLDPAAGTATLVWEYRPDPPISSRIMGSAQRLAAGNTVVGFGVAGRIIEVTPGATAVWDVTLSAEGATAPMQFYRALRVRSLYRYERP